MGEVRNVVLSHEVIEEGLKELLSFVHIVHCLCGGGGRDTYLWEDHSGGERPLGALLVRLFHLSSLINHFTADFLVWFGSLCSFSSEFCRLLLEKCWMCPLLFLYISVTLLGMGEGICEFGDPILWKGSCVNLSFLVLLIILP